MNALQGSFLPMCLSFASGKWVGAATKLVRLRQVASTELVKSRILSTQSRQSDYSTSTVQRNNEGGQGQSRRMYADYTFYKGKGAMCMKPGRPIFKSLDAGGASLDREGSLFLEFAPALGPRQYDWGRKQIMALSVLELGTLVGLSMAEGCEFFHDPFMGKSDAGKVRKVLKVEPMSDQSGFYFNFYMSNKIEGSESKVGVPLTRAEYSVLRSSANYIIPYLMGWHVLADPSKVDEVLSDGMESNPVSANEWDK